MRRILARSCAENSSCCPTRWEPQLRLAAKSAQARPTYDLSALDFLSRPPHGALLPLLAARHQIFPARIERIELGLHRIALRRHFFYRVGALGVKGWVGYLRI